MGQKPEFLSPQWNYEKLKELTNAAGTRLLDIEGPITRKIQLLPNKDISPAKFKAHPFLADSYWAHPLTIQAVRVELFMAGEGFEDLEHPYQCVSCDYKLDLQFWKLCPYCGATPKNS